MSKVPLISGRECVNALQKVDYYIARQRGSHIIMRRDDPYGKVVVSNMREIPRGTMRAIIRQAGLSVEEFVNLL